MENRDELIKLTVSRLKSIKTPEEYKAARNEITDLTERYFKATLGGINTLLNKKEAMSPEEKQEVLSKISDENYIPNPEIGREMERLDSLPGVEEYTRSLSEELEKRIGPLMDEITNKLGYLMDSLTDSMTDKMSEVMEDMAGAVNTVGEMFAPDYDEEDDEEAFDFDQDNPDTPVMLYDLYASRTLDDLEINRESLIQSLEDRLQDDIWFLEAVLTVDAGDQDESDRKKIADVRNRWERFEPEMDKEFDRIGKLPEAAETAGIIKKEILSRVEPKVSELKEMLAKINK